MGSGFIFLFLKKKKVKRWGNNDLQGRQNTVEKKDSPRSSRAGTQSTSAVTMKTERSIQELPRDEQRGSKRVDGGRQPNSLLPEKKVERQDQTLKINYAVM